MHGFPDEEGARVYFIRRSLDTVEVRETLLPAALVLRLLRQLGVRCGPSFPLPSFPPTPATLRHP